MAAQTLSLIVRKQKAVRAHVAAKKLREKIKSELDHLSKAPPTQTTQNMIVATIKRAQKAGLSEDDIADARLALVLAVKRKARAAISVQRFTRGWLCRHVTECPICLDESKLLPRNSNVATR
eukprot:5177664-Prymnesium_polylepis.3